MPRPASPTSSLPHLGHPHPSSASYEDVKSQRPRSGPALLRSSQGVLWAWFLFPRPRDVWSHSHLDLQGPCHLRPLYGPPGEEVSLRQAEGQQPPSQVNLPSFTWLGGVGGWGRVPPVSPAPACLPLRSHLPQPPSDRTRGIPPAPGSSCLCQSTGKGTQQTTHEEPRPSSGLALDGP